MIQNSSRKGLESPRVNSFMTNIGDFHHPANSSKEGIEKDVGEKANEQKLGVLLTKVSTYGLLFK